MDKKTTAEAIGKRVTAGREKAGLSRNRFALTVEIPLTSYRDKELGRRDFDLPQLRRISAALGLDFEFWLDDLPAPSLDDLPAPASAPEPRPVFTPANLAPPAPAELAA